MIPTLCKVHSATFEALNKFQERNSLKYRPTDILNILIMKPLFGNSVVQGRGRNKDPRPVPFFAEFLNLRLQGVLGVLQGDCWDMRQKLLQPWLRINGN